MDARVNRAAVVVHENHQRVLFRLRFLQRGNDGTDGIVQSADHGVVCFLLRILHIQKAVEIFLRCLNRSVHRVEGHVGEERLVLVFVDESHRLAGKCVGQILRFLQMRLVAHDGGVNPLLLLHREVAVRPGEKPKKLVEASRVRMKMTPRAEVPFAEHSSGITGVLQDLGEGDHRGI